MTVDDYVKDKLIKWLENFYTYGNFPYDMWEYNTYDKSLSIICMLNKRAYEWKITIYDFKSKNDSTTIQNI